MKKPRSERKLRLWTCACCRRIWHLLSDRRSQNAIEQAELFADGAISKDELRVARKAAKKAVQNIEFNEGESGGEGSSLYDYMIASSASKAAFYTTTSKGGDARAAQCAGYAVSGEGYPFGDLEDEEGEAEAHKELGLKEDEIQEALYRDIFGDPTGDVEFKASWIIPTVEALAQSIYDERAFDRMPALADILENAGCTNAEILNHCRSEGPHVRGCWVVDRILGKE